MFSKWLKTFSGPDADKIKEILERQQTAIQSYLEHSDPRRFCTIKNGPCQALEFFAWRKDENHLYLYANAAHCIEFFRMPKECINEIQGKSDIDLINEFRERTGLQHSYGELCFSSDEDIKITKECGHYIEVGYVNKELFILDVYKTPILNSVGEFIGSEGYAFNKANKGVLFETIIKAGLSKKCLTVLSHEGSAACYKVSESCQSAAFLNGFPSV